MENLIIIPEDTEKTIQKKKSRAEHLMNKRDAHSPIPPFKRDAELDKLSMNLDRFGYANVKNAINLLKKCLEFGITFEKMLEVDAYWNKRLAWVSEQQAVMDKKKFNIMMLMPVCPECGHHPFELFPIQEPKGKGNKHGYKTRMYCDKCLHEELHKESYGAMMKKIMKEK